MSNDTYYFRGIAEWAKVHKPDPKFDVYTLDLYLDKLSMSLFKDSKLQLQVREGERGSFIKLRRPNTKIIKKELINNGPPKVLISRDGNYVPFEDNIGNGSEVVTRVRVYDTMKGKGHELETVAVESLVPYGGESFTPDGTELPF